MTSRHDKTDDVDRPVWRPVQLFALGLLLFALGMVFAVVEVERCAELEAREKRS